jgi:hypothetical protein
VSTVRLHFYLPGWETPKLEKRLFTNHYGFVSDYLAEAVRELRKQSFTRALDEDFALGSDLSARDEKAVRKTVSGLLKLLHPHGEWAQGELREYLEFALEGRAASRSSSKSSLPTITRRLRSRTSSATQIERFGSRSRSSRRRQTSLSPYRPHVLEVVDLQPVVRTQPGSSPAPWIRTYVAISGASFAGPRSVRCAQLLR